MRNWAVPALTVAAAALVALLLGELALRAVGYSAPAWYRPDPQLGWTLRPGVSGWSSGEGRAWVEVNAAGWRDREHAPDKPPGVYRIAVLGDSYAEAKQVAREETFWARLPQELAACGFGRGGRVEALNFGVAGYGTAQQRLLLESAVLRYRPDLVLLQFTNGNDVRNNSRALEEEKNRPFFVLGGDGALRLDASFAHAPQFRRSGAPLVAALREASDASRVLQLVRAARKVSLVAPAQAEGLEAGLDAAVLAPPREAPWEDAWRVTERLIADIAGLAARHGARFVVVTVPYAVQVHPERALRAQLQERLGVPDLFYPDRRVRALAARHGLDAVALAPEMQRLAEERGTYFHGFGAAPGRGHWNPEGHRTAAALIARRLCEAP